MRIQRFPESVTFDRSILWQYNNATALRRIVSLFNDMMEFSSLKLWRDYPNSLNLEWTGWQEWDNYALKNNRVGGTNCRRIYFIPSAVGMTEGDSLRYFTLRTRDIYSADEQNALQVGIFRAKLYDPSISTSSPMAISTSVSVGDDSYNVDFKFEFTATKENKTILEPEQTYYLEFEKQDPSSLAGWVVHRFNPSICYMPEDGFGGREKSEGLYILNNMSWQPIMKFVRYNTANMGTEEKALMMVANLFGVNNPGYVMSSTEGIPLNLFRRYIRCQISLMDCNGSCKDLNAWAKATFPDIMCLITDGLDMTMSYAFYPELKGEDAELFKCLTNGKELPHPAGVSLHTAEKVSDKKFALRDENKTDTEVAQYSDLMGLLNESRFADPETPLPDGTVRPNDASFLSSSITWTEPSPAGGISDRSYSYLMYFYPRGYQIGGTVGPTIIRKLTIRTAQTGTLPNNPVYVKIIDGSSQVLSVSNAVSITEFGIDYTFKFSNTVTLYPNLLYTFIFAYGIEDDAAVSSFTIQLTAEKGTSQDIWRPNLQKWSPVISIEYLTS